MSVSINLRNMVYLDFTMSDGSTIQIPKATCYNDCFELIKSDYYRIYCHTDNILKIWLKSFGNRSLKIMFWTRMASYRNRFAYYFCLSLHNYYKNKYDCLIHAWTNIGYGVSIGHAISIIINDRTIIGNNVSIGQITNIGTNDDKGAIIGNNVYIAPMTSVIGHVEIGSDTTIGAGSIVTRNIPANSTAVGSPAAVIGANKHPEYVSNRWQKQR